MRLAKALILNKNLLKPLLVMALCACGGGKDNEDEDVTVYSTIKIANAPAGDDAGNASLEFTKVETCSHDTQTDYFQAAFSSGEGKPTLKVNIKNFDASTGKTYTCTQATDNKSGEVGGRFKDCMVEVQTYFAVGGTTLNTYGMYRETAATDDLDYTGTCTVAITPSSGRVTGEVDCQKMIQTHRKGVARNPIDNAATADITSGSSFYCDIGAP